MNFKGQSLLSLVNLSQEEILYLLNLAEKVKAERTQKIFKQRFLGLNLAMVFEKLSTRTRCAFETSFGEEGGNPIFLGKQDIHLGVKESVEDTARVFKGMFDAIVFRGYKQATVETLAEYSGLPVINGLTDTYHPTQVLADLLTLKEEFSELKGLKLVFIGDGNNNVARSLLIGCAKMGIDCTIIAPKEYQPPVELLKELEALSNESKAHLSITSSIEEGIKGADAVYTDVWVSMGQENESDVRKSILMPYQVNEKLLSQTGKKKSIFLHCLPANKEQEVSTAVFEGTQSRVWQQAENRKHTIKAVLLALLIDPKDI